MEMSESNKLACKINHMERGAKDILNATKKLWQSLRAIGWTREEGEDEEDLKDVASKIEEVKALMQHIINDTYIPNEAMLEMSKGDSTREYYRDYMPKAEMKNGRPDW